MFDEESPMAVVVKYQKEPPVMLGPIARELGIKVTRLSLGRAIAGQIMRDPNNGFSSGFSILINSDDALNRQKFTLAHELSFCTVT
jgi:Zn-dependent peptidase ImmA (M78 family)